MRYAYHIMFLALFFCSCTSDEPNSSGGTTAKDNVYLELNKWMYSQMNRQYLWREDLPDSTSCNYELPPSDFFESLLSVKDRFSYFTTNDSYNPSKNLGFAYQLVQDSKGINAWQVLYVTSVEAKAKGVKRGDFYAPSNTDDNIIELQRLQYSQNGFETDYKTIVLSGLDLFEPSTVLKDSVYITNGKRIGYLCYLQFGETKDLEKSLKNFSSNQITDLILDLRYNPGGYVSTCRFLCNCIVPEIGYNNIFQQCSYNNILSAEYYKSTGDWKTYSYFQTPGELLGEQLGVVLTPLKLNKLIVLTSSHTASASEATIVCLRSYMDVITIGEQTVGKGVGSWTISDPRFRYAMQPITMRYYNADGVSTPDDGISPDIYVSDGYSVGKLEIGDSNEKLLRVAIDYINGSTLTINNNIDSRSKIENTLTPIGEPSYVTEYKNKHYNESN